MNVPTGRVDFNPTRFFGNLVSNFKYWVVCSTPHALSPNALSPRALSPHALSPHTLSTDGLSENLSYSEKL